jgi:hypothetical protein
LDEKGSNVIQGHENTNEPGRERKTILQENGHKGVVNTPDYTDTKKSQA